MKIEISKNSGFCQGVEMAVKKVEENIGENVYTLGEIIHNKQVVEKFKKLGVKVEEDINDINSGTVIIRSHGAGEDVFIKAQEKNLRIVDATCMFVKKIHDIVRDYFNQGFKIVIIGESNHPEVKGINGWCYNDAKIISSENDDLEFGNYEKLCIVCQTTFSKDKFEKIIENLKKKIKDSSKTVEIFSTICYTTYKRQMEAENLAEKCDAMIVIGGLNSSNTNKLAEICQKHCQHIFRIESPDELDYKKLKNFNYVGIVAGASTPREQTKEVYFKMENINEQNFMEDALKEMSEKPSRIKKGQKVEATISSANDDGLTVYIANMKKDIPLLKEELIDQNYDKANYASKIGETIEIIVKETTNGVVLSEKLIIALREQESALNEIKDGKEFNVVVDGHNKGGLTAKFGTFVVFIPSSQIRIGFVKELEKYVGKTLRVKLIKIEESGKRKQIVASQRIILEAEKAEKDAIKFAKEDEFFSNINVNDVVTGQVVRFAQFGAFVNVGGFDCLAHISDLAWSGVKTPSDVLEIGKNYDFLILKIDKETKKVSIGYKQLQPKPWQQAAEKYIIGSSVKGKVVRIVKFGAFIEIEKGIDGLVHLSQISHDWMENPLTALEIGQEIEAQILDLDPEKEKMTLSIKALLPMPESVKENPNKQIRKNYDNNDRKPRTDRNSDDITEWNEGGLGGISIADILNKK